MQVNPPPQTRPSPRETAPGTLAPSLFLTCVDGCGRPARWVLIGLGANCRSSEVPVSAPLCDACIAKRFPSETA
jgi:hypothetical protein